jgi:methylated-DNA-[protein]-cysteine S-methyltransferase
MSRIPGFNEKCYELLKLIPEGKVTTYSEMAKALNSKAWRAVGNAMAKNKELVVIPCHRVVRSDGAIGQYALGPEKKAQLLLNEGVEI